MARCPTWRCWAPPAAATSSKASGEPSSRSPAPSSGCARCRTPTGATWCSPPRIPANPYGAGVPWPKRDGAGQGGRRPSRTPGAYVLLRDGEPLLFVERGGRGILRLRELEGRDVGRGDWRVGARRPRGALAAARDRAPRRRSRDRLGARGDADRGRLLAAAQAPGGFRLDAATGSEGDNRLVWEEEHERRRSGRAAVARAAVLRALA